MSRLYRAEAVAAAERLNFILLAEPFKSLEDDDSLPRGSIKILEADFNWKNKEEASKEAEKMTEDKISILKNINLSIAPGETVAVIGRVGSGKSSILLAAMNELEKTRGEVKKNGKVAYLPQEAFLLNETVKENILFGEPYDERRFGEVLEICQLLPDLEAMPAGLDTEIGERGINQSGGQKQRIQIARALSFYKILLDCFSIFQPSIWSGI